MMIIILFPFEIGRQLFNVYHGGTLVYDIPSVLNIGGHAKVQGNSKRIEFGFCLIRFDR